MQMVKPKVLVVDDEEAIRETLAELFADEGYAVDAVGDAAAALRALRTSGPHRLVVMDLHLPDMMGSELYQTMRTDPALAKVPVIIFTAHPATAPAGVLLIKKPVDANILINSVKRILSE